MTGSQTLPLDQRGHLFGKNVDTVKVILFEDHDLILGNAGFSYRCAWCDAWQDFKVIDGVVCQPEPCPYPDGITTTVALAVPSGKLVVFDDLRDTYQLPPRVEEFASYNSVLGQHQVIEAMAAVGCAYGPVGNTCPGLYRTGEGTYAIASPDCDEDKGDNVLPDGWTYLAGIITDLWAYSIADHADFTAKGGTANTGRSHAPEVVNVPPGTYRFTHHTGESGFDSYADGAVIYADIERVTGEATPSRRRPPPATTTTY